MGDKRSDGARRFYSRRAEAASRVSIVIPLAVTLLSMAPLVPASWAVAAPVGRDTAAPVGDATAFCLATEFLPHAPAENELAYRLVREMCRQALLVTARHELGLPTRDETLDERFSGADEEAPPLVDMQVRAFATNDGRLQLTRREAGDDEGDATWNWEFEYTADSDAINTSLATRMEAASRDEFVTALEQLGYIGQGVKDNPQNKPGGDIEQWLGEMNFVSQFAAVRAAHRWIATEGESVEWLGVLARAYANLALLTTHYWNSTPEVFAARSLLYAERTVVKSDRSDDALWHQAYARALVGVHREALEVVAKLDTAEEARSGWMKMIEPFCQFQYDDVLAVAEDHPEVKQLAHVLRFQMVTANIYDRWIYEKGTEALQESPEAYGIYDSMTDGPLGVQRTGAGMAPRAFALYLPGRLLAWEDVPSSVRDHMRDEFTADEAPGTFSPLPKRFATALRNHAATEAARSDEPSWGMLAALIEEEQFVEVANLLEVSQNAVEHSDADTVELVMPLVEGHRYAPYIASFAVEARRQPDEFAKLFNDMEIIDPRGNIRGMVYSVWGIPHGGEKEWGKSLWGTLATDRNFTAPGMVESVRRAAGGSLSHARISFREMYARESRKISPDSPLSHVLKMEVTDAPTADDLSNWEEKADGSPMVWLNLGHRYYKLEQFDAAVRCYQRSIEISRSYSATTSLAAMYREMGEADMWRQTLEAFLEVDDLGLQHSGVHQRLAQGEIDAGNWEGAEPHALAAAQVWSASGLSMAATVTEGLAKWEDSERWTRAASESYPSGAGADWYFWCRRTGRGELDEARRRAELYFSQSGIDDYDESRDRKAVYALLEGRRDEALKIFRDVAANSRRVFEAAHVANLAAETEDVELLKEYADLVDARAENYRSSHPLVYDVASDYASLLRKKKVIDNDYARINRGIKKLDPLNRSSFHYFVGMIAARQGDQQVAEEHLERAVTDGPFSAFNTTLAGHELAAIRGTSRK